MPIGEDVDWDDLCAAAVGLDRRAYAPYSHYQVAGDRPGRPHANHHRLHRWCSSASPIERVAH